jgi:hypothetical protein
MVTDNDVEIRDKYKLPYSLYLAVLYLKDTATAMQPQGNISSNSGRAVGGSP